MGVWGGVGGGSGDGCVGGWVDVCVWPTVYVNMQH